jgi:hypothetical protein
MAALAEQREMRLAVAASMRGASAKVSAADPPPNFSTMSDQDFRAYKAQFGF